MSCDCCSLPEDTDVVSAAGAGESEGGRRGEGGGGEGGWVCEGEGDHVTAGGAQVPCTQGNINALTEAVLLAWPLMLAYTLYILYPLSVPLYVVADKERDSCLDAGHKASRLCRAAHVLLPGADLPARLHPLLSPGGPGPRPGGYAQASLPTHRPHHQGPHQHHHTHLQVGCGSTDCPSGQLVDPQIVQVDSLWIHRLYKWTFYGLTECCVATYSTCEFTKKNFPSCLFFLSLSQLLHCGDGYCYCAICGDGYCYCVILCFLSLFLSSSIVEMEGRGQRKVKLLLSTTLPTLPPGQNTITITGKVHVLVHIHEQSRI